MKRIRGVVQEVVDFYSFTAVIAMMDVEHGLFLVMVSMLQWCCRRIKRMAYQIRFCSKR